MVRPYTPDRGDVVWLEFDPQTGREQAGRRPALILSPRGYNAPSGLAIACPITSQHKGYPFEVVIPTGLRVSGVVLADQARSVNWRQRKATRITTMPEAVVGEVAAKITALVDPQEN